MRAWRAARSLRPRAGVAAHLAVRDPPQRGDRPRPRAGARGRRPAGRAVEPGHEPLEDILLTWQVEEALRRIGDAHRRVLVETHLRGRRYAEVAASSGCRRARSRAASTTGCGRCATRSRRWAMTADDCRVWRERIGALVLGELDPAEEAAAARAPRRLRGLPPGGRGPGAGRRLLRRADAERLGAGGGPPPGLAPHRRAPRRRAALPPQAARGFRSRGRCRRGRLRRRRRWFCRGRRRGDARRVAFDTGDPRVGLSASLTPRPWGTEVDVPCAGSGGHALQRLAGRRAEPGSRPGRSATATQDSDEAALTSALRRRPSSRSSGPARTPSSRPLDDGRA